MEDLLMNLVGAHWAAVVLQLHTYWMVPVGAVVLYYYGQFHFNTPDYSLTARDGDGGRNLVKNAQLARTRAVAPPIFTTSRGRYRRSARLYVLTLEAIFLLVTVFPELVAAAAKMGTAQLDLSKSADERAIWALFGLTGLLSSFPVFKDIDAWLLKQLHQRAAIPDDARLTASTLYDAPFQADRAVVTAVSETLRTRHLRQVAQGSARGTLETVWFKVRCLDEQLKRLLSSPKYREFRRRFDVEFDEIEDIIAQQREKLFAFFSEQERQIPEVLPDIDQYYEDAGCEAQPHPMVERRAKLTFQVEAIFYRMCVFSSLLVYATEIRTEAMDEMFKRLGFGVSVSPVPRVDWEAVIKVAACICLVILVPSYLYTIIMVEFRIEAVGLNAKLIPQDLGTASLWSMIGVAIHTMAIVLALSLKRRYARLREMGGPPMPTVENSKVAAWCFAAAYVMLLCVRLATGTGDAWHSNPWPLLPATTGFFVGLYVDRALARRPVSLANAFSQAAVMFAVASAVCIASQPNGIVFSEWSAAFALFTLYASLTAAGIGLSVGLVFQHVYAEGRAEPVPISQPSVVVAAPALAQPR
jgi:hypothetical protein